MILIFGGTTEGRQAIRVCDEAEKPFFYSTKGVTQEIQTAHGQHIVGAMDRAFMRSFCMKHKIRLVIDAAHPFAEKLHQTIAEVSEELQLPVIRLERKYPKRDDSLFWFNNFDEAVSYLEEHQIKSLLALSGVNTMVKLKPYWLKHTCWFRILDREESHRVAEEAGFPKERILYYQEGNDDLSLFKLLHPQAILTKESGVSGGFEGKILAAKKLRLPVLVIKRPRLSPFFKTVYGENGLRKQIEKLLPTFFALKTGYTTGTCATAATKAAFLTLLTGEEYPEVSITLPHGESVTLPVASTRLGQQEATSTVIKDAGDDPDVTHGHEIVSTVRLTSEHRGIRFLQGEGVGVVTLPGLDSLIGEPAINKTPRKMIENELEEVKLHLDEAFTDELEKGIDVTISVPKGKELAAKTFNPKLGILGGISIIGTSGIVKPFSSEAFIGSIRREMQVAKALDCSHVVINSGAKSERYVKSLYPKLPDQAYIHYGNYIGETIRIASELGMLKVTMGIMIGKAVKLAEGSLDTHSKKVVMNKTFLTEVAKEAHCSEATLIAIQQITMARQLWGIIPSKEYAFFRIIRQRCVEICSPLLPHGELEVLLIDEDGSFVS